MLAFKYRSGDEEIFERDISSIENDYFWSSPIKDLNDPCEALYDYDLLKSQIEILTNMIRHKDDSKMVIENLNNSLEDVFLRSIAVGVFSLSKTYADELLWAHYADSHKGFCIEYDLDILLREKKNNLHLLDVTYSKLPPKITIEEFVKTTDLSVIKLLQQLVGTKSQKWSYEEEVRIISDSIGNQPYDFRAVKSIYFGLRMADKQKDVIMTRLKGRGIKYGQIFLEKKSYQFKSTIVPDKYENHPPYLYKIAPISKYALTISEEGIKNEFRPYISYLYKAIEIARRDPYCLEVCQAAFSYYESKPNNPVVFVNYQKTNHEYSNLYYSIKQIDQMYARIKDLGTV